MTVKAGPAGAPARVCLSSSSTGRSSPGCRHRGDAGRRPRGAQPAHRAIPEIAPPAVSITAAYPGADAQTLENTVTQIVEQQLKGLDHLEYISSNSDGAGIATITLTFAQGTNPDIAQVQVQNKLQQAMPLLPQAVQQQGLVVAKAAKTSCW